MREDLCSEVIHVTGFHMAKGRKLIPLKPVGHQRRVFDIPWPKEGRGADRVVGPIKVCADEEEDEEN